MGQAKQRGTFKERKVLAMVRDEAEYKRQKQLAIEREAAMTPEQRKKRAGAQKKVAMFAGFGLGMFVNTRKVYR